MRRKAIGVRVMDFRYLERAALESTCCRSAAASSRSSSSRNQRQLGFLNLPISAPKGTAACNRRVELSSSKHYSSPATKLSRTDQASWHNLLNAFRRPSQILFIITILFVLPHVSHQITSGVDQINTRVTLLRPRSSQLSFNFASSRHVYPPAKLAQSSADLIEQRVEKGTNGAYRYEIVDSNEQGSVSGSSRVSQIHSQLSELKRQLSAELTAAGPTRQVTLGSPCVRNSDCGNSIAGAHCSSENFTCVCSNQHIEYNSTTCLAASLLGYGCLIDAQCRQRVANSHCLAGVCACLDKFDTYRKDKCLPAGKINDYCLSNRQCQLGDKHSHCRWKIPHVYGICNCPPNFKLITLNETTALGSSVEIRCAPRLGDSCLSHEDCLLATENSVCREANTLDFTHQQAHWRSSNVSSRKCFCGQNFIESTNRLKCLPNTLSAGAAAAAAIETTKTTVSSPQIVSLSASDSMDAKNRYELVISSTTTGGDSTSTSDAEQRVNVGASEQSGKVIPTSTAANAPRSEPSSSTVASTKAATTFTTPRPGLKADPTDTDKNQQQTKTSMTSMVTKTTTTTMKPTTRPIETTRVSSLGKACLSRRDCQARDKHSDCINGICECLIPTSNCNANSTGCHKDTFQCRNGQCISWYFVCDQFKNCDDGSDEEECRPGACPPEAFQCDNGLCLGRGKLCNGRSECGDGSDERHCNSSTLRPFIGIGVTESLTALEANTPIQRPHLHTALAPSAGRCHPRAFTCDNGQCLPAYAFCNAVEDCADGSDEREQVCERRPAHWTAPASFEIQRKWPQQQHASNRTRPVDTPPSSLSLANPIGDFSQSSLNDSPLVKADRSSIDKMLAALNLASRTPESRGRQLVPSSSNSARRRQSRIMTSSGLQPAAECPKWAFTCGNGRCRSSAILCSGVDGCGDNSDENRCQVCKCADPAQVG